MRDAPRRDVDDGLHIVYVCHNLAWLRGGGGRGRCVVVGDPRLCVVTSACNRHIRAMVIAGFWGGEQQEVPDIARSIRPCVKCGSTCICCVSVILPLLRTFLDCVLVAFWPILLFLVDDHVLVTAGLSSFMKSV